MAFRLKDEKSYSRLYFMRNSILVLFGFFAFFLLLMGCKKDKPQIRDNSIGIKARFVADKTILSQGDMVNFTDSTEGYPLTWSWYFEGGIPATSNVQHPKNIRFNELGEYTVRLVVTNAYGRDSVTRVGYIKVLNAVNAPVVRTTQAYDITAISAVSGGELISEGTAKLSEMGLCWSTAPNPTIHNANKLIASETEGSFNIDLNDLEEKTLYYYRAYAISDHGVGYGGQFSFRTFEYDSCDYEIERFVDPRDGNRYKYIQVGDKIWMGENLKYESGESWCYDDLDANCNKYGRLYSIESAKESCPAGWRLPVSKEWDELVSFLGSGAGLKLMKKNEWYATLSSNDLCFSALPAGYINISSGVSVMANFYGYWWTSSKNSDNTNVVKHISYDNPSIVQSLAYDSGMAFSVRCIKN